MRPALAHRARRWAGLAAAGALVALGGCSDDDPEGYGPELRRDFVEECTTAGTSRDICGCFYDSVAAEIPFSRYEQIESRIRDGGEVPDDVTDLAAACAADEGATAAPG